MNLFLALILIVVATGFWNAATYSYAMGLRPWYLVPGALFLACALSALGLLFGG